MGSDLLFVGVDAVRVFLALAIAAAVMAARPRDGNAQLIGLIGVCNACYIVLGRADYGSWIAAPYRIEVGDAQPLLNLMRNLTPGLLMILLRRLFTDKPDTPRPVLAAFALQVFLEGPAQWLRLPIPQDLAQTAAGVLQTVFVLLALYWTVVDYRVDLVEGRRRARVIVAAVVAAEVVAASLLLRVVIPGGTALNYQTYRIISLTELAFGTTFLLWLARGGVGQLLSPLRARKAAAAEPSDGDRAAVARVTALMEDERLYREPGLSLKMLADRAGLPEYRLRRLIHQELGFRNFNAFVHAHRVKEACGRLDDPGERRTPILTIALDAGYQSLNTFNRGFRETMGVTPSAYRARQET